MSDKNKKLKKRLIIVLIAIVSVILILGLLVSIIPKIYELFLPEETEYVANFNFYEADYNENIYDDADYLSLIENGVIEYDNSAGMIVTILPEESAQYGASVKLMVDMVYSIINGNNEEYNTYFSERYFDSHDKKEDFTMQKVYDCRITLFSIETIEEDNADYKKYIYKIRYRIYENNGTFRKDIGDGYRTQYVVVTDREGSFLIDSIMYSQTKK